MNIELAADTLLIIPCCASKATGGRPMSPTVDPLKEMVPEGEYASILRARAGVLAAVRSNPKYGEDKYAKNRFIIDGPDVNGDSGAGLYANALSRYEGRLYSVPKMKPAVEEMLAQANGPKMLILSALYGPLHPHSPIQDYNLMMSDSPARLWATAFTPFLDAYVRQNRIRNVVMYVGSGTRYYAVAKKAVANLRAKRLIAEAVQYHVTDGSTPTTPLQHGLRLLDDLDPRPSEGFPRSVGIVENIL